MGLNFAQSRRWNQIYFASFSRDLQNCLVECILLLRETCYSNYSYYQVTASNTRASADRSKENVTCPWISRHRAQSYSLIMNIEHIKSLHHWRMSISTQQTICRLIGSVKKHLLNIRHVKRWQKNPKKKPQLIIWLLILQNTTEVTLDMLGQILS